ncbi:hypothetical protein [Aestuariivirga sp.]|uniref:hypothetical protein n=1 Tax=Aestuariivirga sp. TaxID=2650926 RepID=UPI0039E69A70
MNSRIHEMALTAELVALCHRTVPEPPWGTDKYDYFTDQDYRNAAEQLLDRRPPGPLWIFAYGSLNGVS